MRELKVNTTILKFLQLPSSAGIELLISAFTRFKIVRFCRFPMEIGMGQCKGLFDRSNFWKLLILQIYLGIGPLSNKEGE